MDNESNNNQSDNSILHPNYLKIFLGIEISDDHFKEAMNYAKNNFQIFSAISVALLTTGLWLFRTMGYCYQCGVFSVYNISKCYIEIDKNFLFQLIQFIAFITIFFLLNYIYLFLSLLPDSSKLKLKSKSKKLIFVLFEMVAIFLIGTIQSGSSLVDIYNELKGYSIFNIIVILAILFLFSILFNVLGILSVYFYKRQNHINQSNSNNQVEETNHNQIHTSIIAYFIIFLILAAILISGSYISGVIEEHNRIKFKIVEVQVENNKDSNNIYIFSDSKNKTAYEIYPVTYENKDIFIVSRLYKDGDAIKIDTNYQKIIEKKNIQAYTASNIYKLNLQEIQ